MKFKFINFRTMEVGIIYAVIGAVFAGVLGGFGSTIGMRTAGVKAAGVIGEKPHLFGKVMIMTALPGSQTVYGLLVAIMIISKLDTGLTLTSGLELFLAGLIVGLSGLLSGIFQGQVAAGGVGAIAKDESVGGGAIILAALIETSAIFGLLIGIMLWAAV